tara:strand:- start:15 stop:533 length:519 start_codon:yes stop_codon:yes gene_type:complete
MIAKHFRIIGNITPLLAKSLNRGTFLCLFGTDKIPPHLGLVVDGKYYSTSAKGSRLGENVELILRRVNQSAIPTLFIKLIIAEDIQKLITAFESYPKLKEDQTCLLPIKDYINSIGEDVTSAKFVFELIPILHNRKLILDSFSLYMKASSFELKVYSKEDIVNRIVKLQETC